MSKKRLLLRQLQSLKQMLANLQAIFQTKSILKSAEKYLEADVDPTNRVANGVACAITVSTILFDYDRTTPIEVSTIKLNNYLRDSGKYELVLKVINIHDISYALKPGDIICSPTEGSNIGHVGIAMNERDIASNNSFGVNAGKFTINYTFNKWFGYFTQQKHLPTYIWRRK